MENKKVVQLPVEYQVGNTKYSVKPIYGEAPNKETVEDKIRRLILSESRNKPAGLFLLSERISRRILSSTVSLFGASP